MEVNQIKEAHSKKTSASRSFLSCQPNYFSILF